MSAINVSKQCPLVLVSLMALGLVSTAACTGSEPTHAGGEAKATRPPAEIVVVSHKEALANYPCEKCHQHVQADGTGAVTNAHNEIKVDHMDNGDRCQQCHDAADPSQLRLASGETYGLDDLHMLCGQCHSKQVADWSVGIHGKQVGNWLTKLHRLSCTGCHDPHAPRLDSVMAVPPPPFPAFGIPKGEH